MGAGGQAASAPMATPVTSPALAGEETRVGRADSGGFQRCVPLCHRAHDVLLRLELARENDPQEQIGLGDQDPHVFLIGAPPADPDPGRRQAAFLPLPPESCRERSAAPEAGNKVSFRGYEWPAG